MEEQPHRALIELLFCLFILTGSNVLSENDFRIFNASSACPSRSDIFVENLFSKAPFRTIARSSANK